MFTRNLGLILVFSALSPNVFAGWLTVDNLVGNLQTLVNSSQNLSFGTPPPGYSGTFTLEHTDNTDGRVDTAAYLKSYDYLLNTNREIGGFLAAGLNPTDINGIAFGSTQTINGCTICNQAGSATLNFSGLQFGYLPQGTLLLISDIDGPDFLDNLRAENSAGVIITAWLSEFKRFDGDGPQFVPHQADPGVNDYPAYTLTNGVYAFPSPNGGDTDTPTFWYYTTQDLTKISFDFGVRRNVPRGFGIFLAAPDVVIPEPATGGLLFVGAIACMVLRRRR